MRRWRVLNEEFPGLAVATSLLSCEEAVEDVSDYVSHGETPASVEGAEKEHVMVGVQIVLNGRPGLLLADPGYHVSRIVTVMEDGLYPHTGWFMQLDAEPCRKEYEYSYSPDNSSYVEWREREKRGPLLSTRTSLVFARRPYLDGVNVTERRNLVYNFKSLVARDQKGHLLAGLYFPVTERSDATFTLFYDSGTEKWKTKYKFCAFVESCIPQSLVEEIEICNTRMNYQRGELMGIIYKLAEIFSNKSFIMKVLEINDDICRVCL